MYTNISKPTGANYTNVNTYLPLYDDSSIIYDDPNVYYDGFDTTAYTNMPKPTGGSSQVILVGMATGLLMPLTYATQHTITVNSPYININKPT